MDMKRISGVIIILGIGALLIGIVSNWNWLELQAIATWFLLLGVVLTVLHVQQARKSTNAQIAVELFKQLRDPNFTKTLRKTIYDNKSEAIKAFIDDDKKKETVSKIEHIIDRFDILGALVAKKIVDEEIAIEAFAGPPALRSWYQLAPFVRELQKRRGFYCIYYEDLSRRSLEHFNNNNIEIWLQLKWNRRRIPLVKELIKLVERRDDLRPRSLGEINKGGQKMGKLSVKGLSISLGIAWAAAVLFIGWVAIFGWGTKCVEVLSSLYIGYAPTLLGGIIGAAWGFVDGAIGGLIIALVYNAIVRGQR
jgi:hypothetical protein